MKSRSIVEGENGYAMYNATHAHAVLHITCSICNSRYDDKYISWEQKNECIHLKIKIKQTIKRVCGWCQNKIIMILSLSLVDREKNINKY